MIRFFDSAVTYPTVDDGLKNWIAKYQRPPVVNFDERTIGDMFGSSKLGIVLFNGADSSVHLDAFTEAAKAYSETDGQSLIFTEIKSSNEHLKNFADYIKINHEKSPLVMINASGQEKFVFKGELTKENILDFISNYESFKVGITDQVEYEGEAEATPTEEEL